MTVKSSIINDFGNIHRSGKIITIESNNQSQYPFACNGNWQPIDTLQEIYRPQNEVYAPVIYGESTNIMGAIRIKPSGEYYFLGQNGTTFTYAKFNVSYMAAN